MSSLEEQIERLRRENRESSFLLRLSNALHKRNTAFDVITTTYETLRDYSDVGEDLTNMALLRPRRQRVKTTSLEGEETTETIDMLLVEATAPNDVELVGARVPFGTGVTGRAASSKTLKVLEDIRFARSEDYLSPVERPGEGSEIAIPLLAEGELIGVLEGQSVTPYFFDTYSLGLFGKIGSIVSAKLQGVADIERDGLCKEVYSKETFGRMRELEIRYAIKGGYNLTMAVLDLDNFKRINDSVGHEAGDHVIESFGYALKHSARESDIVSRIGGDEFAILFPDTTYDEAEIAMRHIAEGLQQRLIEQNDSLAEIFRKTQTTPVPSYGLGSIFYCATTNNIDLSAETISDATIGEIADVMYREADQASYSMKDERKKSKIENP